MVTYVKVKKQLAEKVRRELLSQKLIDYRYPIQRDSEHVYFPVFRQIGNYETVERKIAPVRRRPRSLKEALSSKIPQSLIALLPHSYDLIGSVIVVALRPELEAWAKQIGNALLQIHPNVRTVCARIGIHTGMYRTVPLKVIAGDGTKTTYREHGALMQLDVATMYFSPRLSGDRARIAAQVKDGELIGAWFAGVGPYPLVIYRRNPRVQIHAIEINPEAYVFLEHNIRLNGASGIIHPHLGDVRDVVPKIGLKYDRILMPLPGQAGSFLDLAFEWIRKGGVIHYYSFCPRTDPFTKVRAELAQLARDFGYKIKIGYEGIVGQISPGLVRVVLDVNVL